MTIEEEITGISKLMKIKIADHREYVTKVRYMLEFFKMLDSAGVENEEYKPTQITPISSLREDKHIAFNERLIDNLKEFRDGYIKAPKMN